MRFSDGELASRTERPLVLRMIHLIFPTCRFSVVTGVPPVCAQSAAGTAATTAQSPFSSTYHHSSHGERCGSPAASVRAVWSDRWLSFHFIFC